VPKPPTVAHLSWKHALVFDATSGTNSMVLDGDSREGLSPVQVLVLAVAGCLCMDVAAILTKGRHEFRALRSEITAERAEEHPRRVTSLAIKVIVEGQVPSEAVDRAMQLSHDKYCSVWHSMRQDIALTASFQILP
jgi:putative redox protein